MAADRQAVIAMGREEFVRRWNMGSTEKKTLAELFGFASVASLGNVVNHRPPNGLGWIPGGEPKGEQSEADKSSKQVNPAEHNAVCNVVAASVRKQVGDHRIMNPMIPELFLSTVDGIAPNPEFVDWFSAQSAPVLSALQGSIPDSIWDSNLFLCGVETPRRVAALAAQRAKEQAAIEQSRAIMTSAGFICIERSQFDAMILARAETMLAPSTADIFSMLSNVFPVVREPALPAFDGIGMQYTAYGCMDSRATFSDLLPKADRGCPHVLFYRFKIGEGTKAEQASELKRAKAEQSRHAAETDPTILADWKVYHAAYQDRIDAERAIETAKAAKAAKLAALLDMDDEDIAALLAAKAAKLAA